VADFFHLFAMGYSWYVFNIADVAICAGAAALVYEMIKPQPPKPEPGA
jgi:signal peptidase II